MIKEFLKHYKTDNSCNNDSCYHYLNFWLNEEMKKLKILNDNTIGLYNTFMQCDPEVNSINKKYYKIHEIKNDAFEIIKELYELYYQYKGFITYKTSNIVNACNFALACIEEYNELVFDYLHKDKSNLLNELKNIKQLFDQNGVLTIQNCNKSIPKLQPLPQKPQSLLPLSSLVPIPTIAAMVGILPFLLFLYKVIFNFTFTNIKNLYCAILYKITVVIKLYILMCN